MSFFGEFRFNINTKALRKNDKNIGLTGAEQYLLEIWLTISTRGFREFVIQKLKRSNLRSIDVLVNRLRKKLHQ